MYVSKQGLYAKGAFTADDLYIMVDPKGEGTERYSLRNVMGIYRNQDRTTGEYATSIESGISGGGMQITNDTINMLDGTIAISTENNAKYNISFDGKFNSEQGMTVGTDYTLDNRGNITTTGSISAKGTINGNEITENTFNDVTLKSGEVTADEVTVGDYELSDIGERTAGIISYRNDVTTFDGTIASDAIETSNLETRTIRDGEKSFNVETAADTITLVNDTEKGLAKTYEIASTNKAAIENETTGLGALNQKTTGMSYDEDSQTTTFGQTVSATDFKIGDTSLNGVAQAVNDSDTGLAKTYEMASANKSAIENETTGLGALNQKTTGMSYDEDSQTTTFGQTVSATDFKIGDTSLNGVAQAVNDSDTGLAKTYEMASANKSAIEDETTGLGALNQKTTGMSYAEGTGTTFSQNVKATNFTTDSADLNALSATVGNENSGLVAKTKNLSADGSTLTNMTKITTNTFLATSGSIGSIVFSGNDLTNVASIGGVYNTVTVAGTAISDGSFNSVSITNFTSGTGATINGISIYQDSEGHYNVGTIDLNDLTGSGSGGTVDGIVRTDNGTEGHITTIEENLAINSNGEISNHNDSFKVDADGNVTATNVVTGEANLNTIASQVNDPTTGLKATYDIADANKQAIENADTGLAAAHTKIGKAEGEIDTLQKVTTGMSYDASSGTKFAQAVTATDFKIGNTSLNQVAQDVNNTTRGLGATYKIATDNQKDITALETKTQNISTDGNSITNLTNLTATTGTIGSVTFNGGTATGLTNIDGDVVTVAGTAISNGSFNGVSIYKDANDYIVGDVNISALKGVSGTEIEGIKRTSNNGGGFTTTIEENLAVSTDGTIKQTNGDFAVDTDGNVTGKDFKVNGTSLGDVASAVNDQTKGLKATYDIASANQAAITDEETGLGALNNKTTGMTYTAGTTTADGITEFDHKLKATAFETENLTATEGNIGGISFETVNGVKTIGTDSDTITLAGNAISKGSFNGVSISVDGSNRATFNGVSIYTDSANENDVMVGGINISDLQSGSAEITNKLKGITYSDESGNDYTMNFAEGAFSVSTTGEFTFNYNGQQYGLDKLINNVSSEDLAGFEELKEKVDKLEDKTTGISYDKGTGSTTITSGDNSLTVGDDGITANGDTVINGDTDDNTTGGNGNGSSDPQGGDSIINGDQLVNGDQHVTGDSQFDGTVTVGTGTDGKGQTVIDGGTINTGNTVIDGGQVKTDEGHFGNITVGEDDNQTTIGDDGIKVGDNTTIDNSGVSIKDENGNVFMGDHDVVIKDSEGNVEASLSDVANRVDGIEQSIGDLNSRMGELEDRIDKVGAMAAAIANLRTMGYDPAAPTEVAVGIGQYRNETGAALGLFHYPNRDFMLSLSVSTSGDEVMGGIGATWKFGRKSPEKVAAEKAEKAREAKLQKAEAIKEAARLKKIEAQQERHAKLAAQKTATK